MFAVTVFAMKWHGFATVVAAVVTDTGVGYAYARCERRIFGNTENLDCCDYVTDIAVCWLVFVGGDLHCPLPRRFLVCAEGKVHATYYINSLILAELNRRKRNGILTLISNSRHAPTRFFIAQTACSSSVVDGGTETSIMFW